MIDAKMIRGKWRKLKKPATKPPLGTHARVVFDQLLKIEDMRLPRDAELKALLLNLTGLVASLYDDLEKSGVLRPR